MVPSSHRTSPQARLTLTVTSLTNEVTPGAHDSVFLIAGQEAQPLKVEPSLCNYLRFLSSEKSFHLRRSWFLHLENVLIRKGRSLFPVLGVKTTVRSPQVPQFLSLKKENVYTRTAG